MRNDDDVEDDSNKSNYLLACFDLIALLCSFTLLDVLFLHCLNRYNFSNCSQNDHMLFTHMCVYDHEGV